MLELTPYLERKPGQLSGGQRQRVAMGRAIIRQPQVFLMDEPLSNLDAKLRVQMRADIAELQARLGVTTVYVTHDQAEAMTLGHRVAVLRDARLQQCDTPRALFDRPVNTFVAGFVGSPAMNLCRVPLDADGNAAFGGLPLDAPGPARERPHRGDRRRAARRRSSSRARALDAGGRGGRGARLGRVRLLQRRAAAAARRGSSRASTRGSAPERGERVRLRPSPEYAPHVFDADTGERIGA